ncbi:MAG: hypothetical protein QG670_951 [Thermoproteota archaeon]|nr:hypothetical protein [Thermoproteota archaeon]
MWKDLAASFKPIGLMILVVVSAVLGGFEGSILCFVFSGFGAFWFGVTLGFGLLLLVSLVWAYRCFKNAVPYVGFGIRPMKSASPEGWVPRVALKEDDGVMGDAVKASGLPLERRLRILRVIVDGFNLKETVSFTDVLNYLHSMDRSFLDDEVRDAFEFLLRPPAVIRDDGVREYVLVVGRNELRERLWLLSKVFLESSSRRVFPTKSE